jgi:hypothetical protein
MSKITADMISEELTDAASEGCGMYPGAWDCVDPKEIAAAILNAAIEAGLVSPPGWITRDQFGNIDRIYDGTIVVRSKKPPWEEGVEHWKGQD